MDVHCPVDSDVLHVEDVSFHESLTHGDDDVQTATHYKQHLSLLDDDTGLSNGDHTSDDVCYSFDKRDSCSLDITATVDASDESDSEHAADGHPVVSELGHDTSALSDLNSSSTHDHATDVQSDRSEGSLRSRNSGTSTRLAQANAHSTEAVERGTKFREEQAVSSERRSSEGRSADSLARRTSASSSTSNEEEGREGKARKGSIYEKKQIDAPLVRHGDRINTRKQSLLEQYEKDMLARDSGKVAAEEPVRGKVSQLKNTYGVADEHERMQCLRQEKERELEEVRRAFQERSSEQVDDRVDSSTRSVEVKTRKSLGSLKDRYMAVAHGQKAKDSDDSDSEQGSDVGEFVVDGKAVVKSSGKVEDVRSRESIGNIRSVFQTRSEFSPKSPGNAADVVDSSMISSARSKFRTMEAKKDETPEFLRPTQRRVKDPKELMEARKKVTYGEKELVQDGVVKKSVNIEEEMTSAAKEAHAAYKQLVEKKDEPGSPVRKPVSRLLSDSDARAALERKRHSHDSSTPSSPDGAGVGGDHSLANGGIRFESPGSEMV